MTQLEVRFKATHLVNMYPATLELSFLDKFAKFTSIIESSEDKSQIHEQAIEERRNLLLASFCGQRAGTRWQPRASSGGG